MLCEQARNARRGVLAGFLVAGDAKIREFAVDGVTLSGQLFQAFAAVRRVQQRALAVARRRFARWVNVR